MEVGLYQQILFSEFSRLNRKPSNLLKSIEYYQSKNVWLWFGKQQMWVRDKWEITNLGAILFANNLADFPRFESKHVMARKYQGDSNRFLERDLFFRKGYACEL